MKSILKVLLTISLMLIFVITSNATDKKLIVATDTAFVPFEFKQGNKYIGFDIELWDMLAKQLNLKYSIKPMDFSGIIPALQTKHVDLAMAGITVTKERQKAVDFSEGYYKSGLHIMVKSNNNNIKNINDLNGKIIAVKSGTGSVDYVKQHIKFKDLKQFPNIDNAYMELATNRADAVLHDAPNVLYFIHTFGKNKFKIIGKSIEAQEYAIAFPKGNNLLRKQINMALKNLHNNGTYNILYKKWFGIEPK